MNLADYLDTVAYKAPRTAAPLAPARVTYAPTYTTTAAPTRTAPTVQYVRGTVSMPSASGLIAPTSIPVPPPSVIQPGISPLIFPTAPSSPAVAPVSADAIPPPPSDTSASDPGPTQVYAPSYAPMAPAPSTPAPDQSTAPADGSSASGDSGGSSSGFGWLLIALGGYWLYKGLKK